MALRLVFLLLAVEVSCTWVSATRASAAVGDVRFVRQLEGSPVGDTGFATRGPRVVLDHEGNSYVAGENQAPGLEGVFLVSYDASGSLRWANRLNDAIAHGQSVTVTSDAVYLIGYHFGPLENAPPPIGGFDIFVVRYDLEGTFQWARVYGSTSDDFAWDAAMLDATTIGVAGATAGTFPGSPVPNAGDFDALFLRISSSDGSLVATRQLGTSSSDLARAIVSVHPHTVIAGESAGTLPGAPPGNTGAFVASYLSSGVLAWLAQPGAAGGVNTRIERMSASLGTVYVVGRTETPIFGGTDAFVAAFDGATGASPWTRQFGSTGDDIAYDVADDGGSNVYVSGGTTGTLAGSSDPNAGGSDAFLARFDAATGTPLAPVRQLGSPGDDVSSGIALDEVGNPHLVGHTDGTLPGSPDANPADPDLFLARFDGEFLDTDGDGLYDEWETNGIDADRDGDVDLDLSAPPYGADPDHKDIFVEVDWMSCALNPPCAPGDVASHELLPGASTAVVAAFANAPVPNPDGTTGIRLHILPSEGVPEQPVLGGLEAVFALRDGGAAACDGLLGSAGDRSSANCAAILAAHRLSFHYAFLLHELGVERRSGYGRIYGNVFSVHLHAAPLMGQPDPIQLGGGLQEMQASVFMHELGHNLGLHHGGRDDPDNCKPNYLSVMNYPYTSLAADPNRPLDFSREALPDLDELSLDETLGISGYHGRITAFGDSLGDVHGPFPADGPLDFDLDGSIETTVVADVNNMTEYWRDCRGDPQFGLLRGRDDWSSLDYNWRNGAAAGGPTFEADDEPDGESIVLVAQGFDADGDGFVNADDNCPGAANPDQDDADGDGIGDACEAACSDGLDGDGDTFTDYPADPGCKDAASDDESPQCQDGVNNDGQTGVDFDGGASAGNPTGVADPQCWAAWRDREAAKRCGLGFEVALLLPLLAWLARSRATGPPVRGRLRRATG
jgi:hypothetical protein